ncbi:MAG: hypothetical protein WCX27_00950 [Candidatus Paceibacterota bacterium]|jgi:hypothetical protein
MSLDEPIFVEYIKKVFRKYDCDYELIKNTLNYIFNENPSEKDRLAIYSHFYYFICTPDKIDKEIDSIREELQIVGITSLIEAMMGDDKYKDAFAYFESEFPNKNEIADVCKFKKDYFAKYGANTKIVNYFEKYIPKVEADKILSGIKKWSSKDKKSIPITNLDELARFLYQMRSDFVHKAEMRCFCPSDANLAAITVGDKYYILTVRISEILDIFEKSFVNYWKEKYETYKIIKDVGFDFHWSEEKVWALDIPVEEIYINNLVWHFDIPFLWEKGVYDLKPQEVIDNPDMHKKEYERTMKADLVHPIDIMENKGHWLILDGLHRLMKAYILKIDKVQVRKVSREHIHKIEK